MELVLTMEQRTLSQIIQLIRRAQTLALKIGIPNILQPGLVKEMIVAEILGHQIISSKRDADARDRNNPQLKYEYLTCYENGTGQLDRMFKEPAAKRAESLNRITRNHKIYLTVFYQHAPLTVKTIYELEPNIVRYEAERQLNVSRNAISHVGFSERWALENGRVIYRGNVE